MAKTLTVRISKTWHCEVPVEYGDDDDTIRARALAMHRETDELQGHEALCVSILPTSEPTKPTREPTRETETIGPSDVSSIEAVLALKTTATASKP